MEAPPACQARSQNSESGTSSRMCAAPFCSSRNATPSAAWWGTAASRLQKRFLRYRGNFRCARRAPRGPFVYIVNAL